MMQLYDMQYKIFDHLDEGNLNPLSSVAMHEAETYFEHSGLYRAIERYHRQGILTRFGLSLTEYLDLPRDIVEMITSVWDKISKEQSKIEADIRRKLESREKPPHDH